MPLGVLDAVQFARALRYQVPGEGDRGHAPRGTQPAHRTTRHRMSLTMGFRVNFGNLVDTVIRRVDLINDRGH